MTLLFNITQFLATFRGATLLSLLYSKTGVNRSIYHFSLVLALKHRLWVFLRMDLTSTHNLCFEQN